MQLTEYLKTGAYLKQTDDVNRCFNTKHSCSIYENDFGVESRLNSKVVKNCDAKIACQCILQRIYDLL